MTLKRFALKMADLRTVHCFKHSFTQEIRFNFYQEKVILEYCNSMLAAGKTQNPLFYKTIYPADNEISFKRRTIL